MKAFSLFLIDILNFKKTFKIILIMFMIFFLNVTQRYPAMSESLSTKVITENYDNINYPLIVRGRLHEKLVNEVKAYIETTAPTSKVDPELLVTMCQKYDLDIIFVLSQALLESHFGTKGKATVTNSVFNVGAYDDGKITHKYSNVNESIEPYMILLTEKYLVNKELNQLIQDRGYKNIYGSRFATSSNYEESLRTLMINIDMTTSIKMYQEIINLSNEQILVYFAPIHINEPINLQANNDTIKRTI